MSWSAARETPVLELPLRPHVVGLPATEVGGTALAQVGAQGLQRIIRLNSNEGPFEPFPQALAAIERTARELNRYPHPAAGPLVQMIAQEFDIAPDQVLVEAGSTQLILLLAQACLGPGDELVHPWPSFPIYTSAALRFEARAVRVPLRDTRVDLDALLGAITPRTRLVMVCNPNNPTGTAVARAELDRFVSDLPPGVMVLLDEAYAEFADQFADGFGYVRAGRPVVVLRTFSKIYGLAGARVGFACGPAGLIAALGRLRTPYAVNQLALAAAAASLPLHAAVAERAEANRRGREQLCEGFQELGLRFVPSQANFVLVEVGPVASGLARLLMAEGIVVRPGRGYDCPNHLRVTVGLPEENAVLLEALARLLPELGMGEQGGTLAL